MGYVKLTLMLTSTWPRRSGIFYNEPFTFPYAVFCFFLFYLSSALTFHTIAQIPYKSEIRLFFPPIYINTLYHSPDSLQI